MWENPTKMWENPTRMWENQGVPGGGSPWLVGMAAAATMAMVVAMAAAMAVAMVAGVAVAAVVVCTGSLCLQGFQGFSMGNTLGEEKPYVNRSPL